MSAHTPALCHCPSCVHSSSRDESLQTDGATPSLLHLPGREQMRGKTEENATQSGSGQSLKTNDLPGDQI